MKYLKYLINEAEEINDRFEESKELLLCISDASKFEKLIYKEVIKKYDMVIASVFFR